MLILNFVFFKDLAAMAAMAAMAVMVDTEATEVTEVRQSSETFDGEISRNEDKFKVNFVHAITF